MKPPIRIKNLLVTRANTTICDISELTIEHGMCLGVQGINGSGKSTLLRVLAGLESEYNGLVDIPELYHPVGFVPITVPIQRYSPNQFVVRSKSP